MSVQTVTKSTTDLLFYLEMGNLVGSEGNDQEAIDYYIKGLQIARELEDKARVQQFSNLILTYL
ncbi:MAG: hypothetical protein RI883_1771 [Bacteroidota bacterium]|jgi:hypothetical protein